MGSIAEVGWTSAFVTHNDRLHVASARIVAPAEADSADGAVLVVVREVDQALLTRLSADFLVQDIKVQPPSDIRGIPHNTGSVRSYKNSVKATCRIFLVSFKR